MQNVSQSWKDMRDKTLRGQGDVKIKIYITEDEDNNSIDIPNVTATYQDNRSKLEELFQEDVIYQRYADYGDYDFILDGGTNETSEHYGYVGNEYCTNTTFTNKPTITIPFKTLQTTKLNGISIVWSTAFLQYATSYNVKVYAGSTLVTSGSKTNNTDIRSFLPLNNFANYDKVVIEVNKWSLPNSRCRIESIVFGEIIEYGGSDIVTFTHRQTGDILSFDNPSSSVEFEIYNTDDLWNPLNPTGKYKYLHERQKIVVSFGFNINGTFEYIPCGKFYLSEWDTPQNGETATFVATDLFGLMSDKFVFDPNDMVDNKYVFNLHLLAEKCFEDSKIPSSKYEIDEALTTMYVAFETGDLDLSNLDMLKLVANASCRVLNQDREGKIKLKAFSRVSTGYSIDRYNATENANVEADKVLKTIMINDKISFETGVLIGEVQTIVNPLIQQLERIREASGYIVNILTKRNKFSGEYRTDLVLDVYDIVNVETKYGNQRIIITEIENNFDGTFTGSYKGRQI